MMVYKQTALLVRHCRSWPKHMVQYQGFQTSVRHYSTFYDVLEIKRTATPKEIKRAYINASKKHHPDVSSDSNAHEQFTKIAAAYEVLGNPHSKLSYDSFIFNTSTGARGHHRHATWEDFDMANGRYRDKRNGWQARNERYWDQKIEIIMKVVSLFLDVVAYTMLITFVVSYYIDRREKGLNFIFPPRPPEDTGVTKKKRSKNYPKGSKQKQKGVQ